MKDTRVHILETAYTLFMQSGYKAVTMNDIVKQTGLSKGAFYHYFNSKEQLFENVINHVFFCDFSRDYQSIPDVTLQEFMQEELLAVRQRHKSLLDSLRTEDKRLNLNYYTLIFDALRMLPEFKKRFEAYKAARVKTWVKVLDNAKKNKEINTPISSENLTKMFTYINQGVGMNFMLGIHLNLKYKEISELWNELYDLIKT